MTFFATVETASATAATTTASKIAAPKCRFGLSLALFEFFIAEKKERKKFRSMIARICANFI
jgi:hypothetical protein